MSHHRVYLCGSLTGVKGKDAQDWREEATLALVSKHVLAYSPTRGKTFDPEAVIELDSEMRTGDSMSTPKGINMRDYLDTIRADALLVYLDVTTPMPSMGSVAEMAWAFDRRIPVIAVVPADSIYMRHPMVSEFITYRVDTVTEGVRVVLSVLLS